MNSLCLRVALLLAPVTAASATSAQNQDAETKQEHRDSAQPSAELEETPNDIGYPTVALALQDLRSRPGVVANVQNGWVIIADQAAKTVWSFAPPGHPAYPAAVKRQAVESVQGAILEMTVLCEASKQACDDLVREFQQLNAKMTRKSGG